MEQINYVDIVTTKDLVDDYFDALIEIEPRIDYVFETSSESEDKQQEIPINRKWQVCNSIFKDYQRDT